MKLWQVCSNSLRNGYSKIFEVADYESQNKKSRIQYGGQLHDFLVKPCQFRSNSLMNDHSGVIEVVDYESEVRISKFKMADLMAVKYIIFEWNFDIFALVRLGTANQRFLRSPITNLKSSHSWDKVSNFFKFTHQIEKKMKFLGKQILNYEKAKQKLILKKKGTTTRLRNIRCHGWFTCFWGMIIWVESASFVAAIGWFNKQMHLITWPTFLTRSAT